MPYSLLLVNTFLIIISKFSDLTGSEDSDDEVDGCVVDSIYKENVEADSVADTLVVPGQPSSMGE